MKRQWSGVFVAALFATTAVVGAQGGQQPNTPPPDAGSPAGVQRTPPSPSAQTKSANTVTLSGCIQDTPAVAAAAGAPAGAGQSSTKTYYLNNAMMAADAGKPGAAVGTSGLSSTGYRLEGDTALISPHLNHQVRITGTVQSSSASATGAAAAAPGSTAAGPTLKVESVTMVAAKCEEKK